MSGIRELEKRVTALDEQSAALMEVVNGLMELIYDRRFIGKLDKLVRHGKKEED